MCLMCSDCDDMEIDWYEEYYAEQNKNDRASQLIEEMLNVLPDDMTYIGQDGKWHYVREEISKILNILEEE